MINRSTSEIITEFSEETSVHGVKRACNSKSKYIIRVTWTILLLASTAGLTFQISQLVTQYLRYQVNVKRTTKTEPLLLPSITICNLNLIPINVISSHDNFDTIVSLIKTMGTLYYVDLYQEVLLEKPGPIEWDDYPVIEDVTEEDLQIQLKIELENIYHSMNLNLTERVVGVIDDAYPNSFNKWINSTLSDYDTWYNYEYGLCATFPSKKKYPNGLTIDSEGPLNGIYFLLYASQSDYIPLFTSTAGFRLTLSEFGTVPDIGNQQFLLPTGFETNLAIRPIITNHLSDPYGECYNGTEYTTFAGCIDLCLEKEINRKCNCTADTCSRTDKECTNPIYKMQDLGLLPCNCFEPCRRYQYDVKHSQTRWPAKTYRQVASSLLSDLQKYEQLTDADLAQEVVSLRVYFRRISTIIFQDEPAYQIENLLSDIGGQLGLWLGVSVLSILEVCGCVMDIFRSIFLRAPINPKIATKVDTTAF